MQISRQGLDLIKSFEGFCSTPYRCPGGYKTIGYGHVIRPYEERDAITEKEAYLLLCKDVGIAGRAVQRLIDVPLNQNQIDALTSFTFNLGAGALQRSMLRQCVNRGEHEAVPNQLMKWVRVKAKISPGLIRRRKIESIFYQLTI